MTPGNGTQPPDDAEKSLGEIVSEVSEKASLLVREEIELAKAEIQQKIGRLTKGAAVGVVAGVFAFFAFVIFLHALSWFWFDLFDLSQV
jgi:putative superfamily III holin-X